MKVTCPDCEAVIPAEHVSLETGWAKCIRCNEVFPLADLVEGYSPEGAPKAAASRGKPERPFDAWAIVEHDGPRMLIHFPPQGLRAGAWGLLFFAIFWNGFVFFWTLGALGVFFNQGQIQWENLAFAAFSTPFWLVGFGMLAAVLWMARGSRTVYFDGMQMISEMRCLFWRRNRVKDLVDVQHAREGRTVVKSDAQTTPYSVEIVFTKGSISLPCSSENEQRWLIAEVNEYLQRCARGG